MINQAMFSSTRQNWRTPEDFLAVLKLEFDFDCDPCFLESDTIHMQDMLGSSWGGKTIYVNPPYNKLRAWVQKAVQEHLKGKTIIMLLPARTDTIAFHDYILPYASEIRFIKGRLKFSGHKDPAPFPSMLAIFRANDQTRLGEYQT